MSEHNPKERFLAHRLFQVGEKKPNDFEIRNEEVEKQKAVICEKTQEFIKRLADDMPLELHELKQQLYTDNYNAMNYAFYRLAQVNQLRLLDLHNILVSNLHFKRVDFSRLDLSGIKFEQCYFEDCDFTQCKFIRASLNACIFHCCQYSQADFSHCSARDVWFGNETNKRPIPENAQFNGAIFQHADLQGSVIIHDFANVDARDANLQNVWFQADLRGTNLTGANLLGATSDFARYDGKTIMPDGNPPDAVNSLARFSQQSDPFFWKPKQSK